MNNRASPQRGQCPRRPRSIAAQPEAGRTRLLVTDPGSWTGMDFGFSRNWSKGVCMKSGIEHPGRRGSPDALIDMRDKLREVAAEEVGQAACRLVVCIGLFPGRARIEDIAIDAFDRDRAREAEIGVDTRSEERRVGKECVSPCRSRWSPYQ